MYATSYAYPTAPDYTNNIVAFPIAPTKPRRPANNNGVKHTGHKSEVYPFKTDEDILAMQKYFLNRAKNADTAYNRNQWLRNFLYFALGINIGFRCGDVSELRWSEVLDENGQVYNGLYHYITEQKTGKTRQLIFNADCKKAIEFYLTATGITPKPNDYLFPSRKGNGHMTVNSLGDILKDAAKACGIKYNVNTHSLRKTFGYRYYKNGGDLATLQKIFNHSSAAITLRYIGIDAEVIKDAYEVVNGALIDSSELAEYEF